MIRVRPVEAAATHDLRRRVLRDGDPEADLSWAGDDAPTTVHLAAIDTDDRIVGVSTWLRDESAVQLRGMATEPSMAGAGIGSMILGAGIDRFRAAGCELIWANARLGALAFYERAGFAVTSDVFETPETGLPHRRVELRLV